MKKLLLSSIILTFFSLSIILVQVSCTKEAVAQTDPAATREEILVAKTWKVDKLHHVIEGKYSSFSSGGTNNTGVNYDLMRFTFNADGTGVHIDQSGVSRDFTWMFLTADKRSLQITVAGRTDTWDMVEIADNYLHASVNVQLENSTDNIETFRLKQVP